MATSVLDVRGSAVPSGVPARQRRVPAPALAAGVLGVLEGLGLLAVALTGLDGLLAAPSPPAAPVVAGVLLGLAGWIVLAAGTGVALVDASGRRGFVALAVAESVLAGLLLVVVVTSPAALPVPGPSVVLLATAVPLVKLLLARAPATRRWAAQGPRVRASAPDPVAAHRLLAALTLAAIGAALVALTVLVPADVDGAFPGGTVSGGTVSGAVDGP